MAVSLHLLFYVLIQLLMVVCRPDCVYYNCPCPVTNPCENPYNNQPSPVPFSLRVGQNSNPSEPPSSQASQQFAGPSESAKGDKKKKPGFLSTLFSIPGAVADTILSGEISI